MVNATRKSSLRLITGLLVCNTKAVLGSSYGFALKAQHDRLPHLAKLRIPKLERAKSEQSYLDYLDAQSEMLTPRSTEEDCKQTEEGALRICDDPDTLRGEIVLRLSQRCLEIMMVQCHEQLVSLSYDEVVKDIECHKIDNLSQMIANTDEKIKKWMKEPEGSQKYNNAIVVLIPTLRDMKLRKRCLENHSVRLFAQIYLCAKVKLDTLSKEREVFMKTAEEQNNTSFIEWYYENALTEFIDLELPKDNERQNLGLKEAKDLKQDRKDLIRKFIENAAAGKIAKISKVKNPKKHEKAITKIVNDFFFTKKGRFMWLRKNTELGTVLEKRCFQIADNQTIFSNLSKSAMNVEVIGDLFPKDASNTPSWPKIVQLINKFKKHPTDPFEQSYDTGCGQTPSLPDLDKAMNTGIFEQLKEIQNFIHARMKGESPSDDDGKEMESPLYGETPTGITFPAHFKTKIKFRDTPKKPERSAIKSLRKKNEFNGRFAKDSVGSTVIVTDEGDLEGFKSFLENFLESLKSSSKMFGAESMTIPNLPEELKCQGIRLMELKAMTDRGYKDVKMIFQALITNDQRCEEFYNFEMIFLLEGIYDKKSESHGFYKFTRQFGVVQGKKDMSDVLVDMEPTPEDRSKALALRRQPSGPSREENFARRLTTALSLATPAGSPQSGDETPETPEMDLETRSNSTNSTAGSLSASLSSLQTPETDSESTSDVRPASLSAGSYSMASPGGLHLRSVLDTKSVYGTEAEQKEELQSQSEARRSYLEGPSFEATAELRSNSRRLMSRLCF